MEHSRAKLMLSLAKKKKHTIDMNMSSNTSLLYGSLTEKNDDKGHPPTPPPPFHHSTPKSSGGGLVEEEDIISIGSQSSSVVLDGDFDFSVLSQYPEGWDEDVEIIEEKKKEEEEELHDDKPAPSLSQLMIPFQSGEPFFTLEHDEGFYNIGPTRPHLDGGFEPKKKEDKEEQDGRILRMGEEMGLLLQEFLEAAFTLLIFKFGVQPKDWFEMEDNEWFGMIPVLSCENSQAYVESTVKTIVHFIKKGVLDSAVFHANIQNGEKCLITQERVVIRVKGLFKPEEFQVHDLGRVEKVKNKAKLVLSKMMNDLSDWPFKEVDHPEYSQWHLSVGMNEQFANLLKENGHGPIAPFSEDPERHVFPWKKRPRISQAVKLGLVERISKRKAEAVTPPIKYKSPEKKVGEVETSSGRSSSSIPIVQAPHADVQSRLQALVKSRQRSKAKSPSPTKSSSEQRLLNWTYLSSSSSSDSDEELVSGDDSITSLGDISTNVSHSRISKSQESMQKIKPISSHLVLPNLVMMIYTIEYPENAVSQEQLKRRPRHAPPRYRVEKLRDSNKHSRKEEVDKTVASATCNSVC